MTPPLRRIALCLFGSGMCALVYQVAWLRELRLVFGASTAASAAVLAVFMGGLGVGGLWLGRRVARQVRPLMFYGNLELGIAAAAALTPFLVTGVRWAYVAVGGTTSLGMVGGTIVRLILSALILAVPTFLMGGTLPAAAEAVEGEGDDGRRRLAVLYGANTLGAVVGTLLSTFALLEILGTRRMLWSACLLNALVALIARNIARRMPERDRQETVSDGGKPRTAAVALVAAALVGFAFLLMELVWYRMLGPILGGSSFTFGLILAMALLGIGLGGIAYALFGTRTPTLRAFAITCALEALLIVVPYALGDRIALWAALIRPLGGVGFGGQVAGWALITSLVVLPAAFVSGVQFPLLIALLGRGGEDVGRQVGLAYAWNTAGAIAGSLAGGFGLLPLMSAPGAWRLVVILLVGLCLGALAIAIRHGEGRLRGLMPFGLAALALVMLRAPGPGAPWRHGAIGAGRGPTSGTPNQLALWSNALYRSILWEKDGVESSVALDGEVGLAFVVNGKIDGNARSDAPTQVMSGLLGGLIHPSPKRSMVIGLGTGSTAGWMAKIPDMERVDVAELEPAILHVGEACAAVNHDVLKNPKVKLFLGDAREQLLTTRDQFDLIFSEPSNPYRAGIASLFTRDFYAAVKPRLRDGGLFLQWVQAYSVDAQTVRTVMATLASEFPHVETWVTQEADLLLVASHQPIRYDAARMRQRITTEPYRSALANIWRVSDLEGVFAHHAAGDGLARTVAIAEGDDLNTDDQTLVEFGFARNAGRRDALFHTSELRVVARARGADRPPVENGTLDWKKVDERRLSMLAAQESSPSGLPYPLSPSAQKRSQAITSWLVADLKGALAHFREQPEAPADPLEVLMVAEGLAESGDDAALPLADQLRSWEPIEADAIVARLRLRQNKIPAAAEALERALAAYRTDPWPMPAFMSRALRLTVEIAAHDRALGERFFQLMEQPFAVRVLDEQRMNLLVQLATLVDYKRLCVRALSPFEPYPSWRKEFLAGRWNCYEQAGDPRAAAAQRDLLHYNALEPLPFATGLTK
jgi:spermidine synthase